MRVGDTRPARAASAQSLELWAGPEASYVRVGDTATDQQVLNGFSVRPGDLERLASLGARRVRFPLLWEREEADRQWAAHALPRLKQLGVAPVLGLIHHGGGPLPGGLLDPGFADGLAAYAGRVARRFPWIEAYTPVNEPLTTARFSGLYGLWYPHGTSDAAFVRALLAELRGTVLAMRAVREINPEAALIQTEDMGKVYGTPAMHGQVEFENLRRWLSFDLLCGRVDEGHGLWSYLTWAGATPEEIHWFAENPCPPQVLGLNVYPTSERFLDERIEHYPARFHGGNERQRYADVEAVRVRADLPGLFFERLMEAHDRYGLPLALTEVHLGCSREDQLRWLNTGWQDALRAKRAGADVRAVTAWSAFGSFEWNSLLTRREGHYEAGLWDVSVEGPPRETALAALCRELASGATPTSPVLAGPGWWLRAERRRAHFGGETEERAVQGPVLAIGPGPLAERLTRLCQHRGLPCVPRSSGSEGVVPWASLDANTPDKLTLHALGRGALVVQATALSDLHLGEALNLLLDGETGEWLWDGTRFSPVGRSPDRDSAVRRPYLV